jgi:hypothetical protein
MEAGQGTKGGPGRFPYSIIVLLVVTLVISSAVIYSLPGLMMSTEFHGFVRDESGRPIPNATVSAVEGSVMSSSDGSYSLAVRYNGPFDIQAKADGHWVQKMRVLDIGTTYSMNFTLLTDIQTTVPTGLAFVTLNATAGQEAMFGWTTTDAGMQASIEDFDPNASTMKFTFDSSEPVGKFQSIGASTGLLRRCTMMVSGTYGSVPGQVTNCYVTKVTSDIVNSPIPEYLNQSAATSEVIVSNDFVQRNDPHQDLQLPSSLGVAVSADILGKEFNTTLPVTWSSSGPCMRIIFHMEGGTQLEFKLLIEDGWIIHMWLV